MIVRPAFFVSVFSAMEIAELSDFLPPSPSKVLPILGYKRSEWRQVFWCICQSYEVAFVLVMECRLMHYAYSPDAASLQAAAGALAAGHGDGFINPPVFGVEYDPRSR